MAIRGRKAVAARWSLAWHSDKMSQKSGCAVSISCRLALIGSPQMVSFRHCAA
jgi:hypothetical protein